MLDEVKARYHEPNVRNRVAIIENLLNQLRKEAIEETDWARKQKQELINIAGQTRQEEHQIIELFQNNRQTYTTVRSRIIFGIKKINIKEIKPMKKRIAILMIILSVTSVGLWANEATLPLRIVVNNERIYFPDAQPFSDMNNRIQVPVRFIAEELGAEVQWEQREQKVTITLGNRTVELKIDKKEYMINNQKYTMDTKAVAKEGRSFVPIRFVSEALGAEVEWNQNITTVYITMGATPAPLPQPIINEDETVYFDGISFNPSRDLDEYGRMNEEKSQEFLIKLAEQIKFVKEDGEYVIKGTYPELPPGFEFTNGITIYMESGRSYTYNPLINPRTQRMDFYIPREGSFTKVVDVIDNVEEIDTFYIGFGVRNVERISGKDSNTGTLGISAGKGNRIFFAPITGSTIYYEEGFFDFDEMFQW